MERDSKPDFQPEKVLKVYKSGSDAYYIEVHPVYKRKDQYTLGAGQPLTRKTLQKLLGAAMAEDGDHIWWDNPIMPQCLLSFCVEKYKRHIMWWRPKTVYNMLFADGMSLKSGPVSMPAMLFFVQLDKIRIFALKESKRPTFMTKLFHAPLLNSVENNQLCWGNVSNETHDVLPIDKELGMWEHYLWNSKFSHGGAGTATKHPIIDVYKKIGHNKPFPLKELVDTGFYVEDLINEI